MNPERPTAIALACELDVDVADVDPEQLRQELGIVHVRAVGRIAIAAGTRVDPDAHTLLSAERLEHAVVQVDERPQKPPGRVELDGEPPLREVDLHAVGTHVQRAADVEAGFPYEVVHELLPRVPGDAVPG